MHVDAFSKNVAIEEFNGTHPTGEEALVGYLDTVPEAYNQCIFNVGPNCNCKVFKDFLQQCDSTFLPVPTGAHLLNKDENGVQLINVEIPSLFSEFPYLPNRAVLRLEVNNLNRRYKPQYKASRRTIHSGRREPRVSLGLTIVQSARRASSSYNAEDSVLSRRHGRQA